MQNGEEYTVDVLIGGGMDSQKRETLSLSCEAFASVLKKLAAPTNYGGYVLQVSDDLYATAVEVSRDYWFGLIYVRVDINRYLPEGEWHVYLIDIIDSVSFVE